MTNLSKGRALLAAAMVCWVASASAAEGPAPGTVVAEGDMPMVCQQAVAARWEIDPETITTNTPIVRDGKFLVLGMFQGENNEIGFECRFEGNGAYIDVFGDPAAGD